MTGEEIELVPAPDDAGRLPKGFRRWNVIIPTKSGPCSHEIVAKDEEGAKREAQRIIRLFHT